MNRKTIAVLVLAVLASALTIPGLIASAAPWQSKVDPWVLETSAEGPTEFMVFLKEQADLSGAAVLADKAEKGRFVYEALVETAARRVKELEAAGGFTFLPVGIQDADLERLAVFSARRRPLRLKGQRFAELFNWLFRSVRDLSRSQPGDSLRLPPALHSAANPAGWAELDG